MQMPTFLSTIQDVATVSGINLTSWSPIEELPEEFYAKVPMKLTLIGKFHQVLKFFYGVGQQAHHQRGGHPHREDSGRDRRCGGRLPHDRIPLDQERRNRQTPGGRSRTLNPIAIATLAVAMLAAQCIGCGDERHQALDHVTPAAGASGTAAAAQPKPQAPPTSAPPPACRRSRCASSKRDFAESNGNRDPFRSFAADLIAQNRTHVTIQRKVLVDRYALKELKLVGLVIGAPSRALLIDPTGPRMGREGRRLRRQARARSLRRPHRHRRTHQLACRPHPRRRRGLRA